MKKHQVFTEIHLNDIPQEDRKNLIQSRWVHRDTEVRSRIVAKGYNEVVSDLDDIYATTPTFCILRILLTLALAMRWTISTWSTWRTSSLHVATSRVLHRPEHPLDQRHGKNTLHRS